jgi:hypothetical protein
MLRTGERQGKPPRMSARGLLQKKDSHKFIYQPLEALFFDNLQGNLP